MGRKRPAKHTVHTKHPRYNVPQYPRGSGNITEKYLGEKVTYGGEVVTREAMIKDLWEIAKQRYPDDKKAQQGLVNAYLSGHGAFSNPIVSPSGVVVESQKTVDYINKIRATKSLDALKTYTRKDWYSLGLSDEDVYTIGNEIRGQWMKLKKNAKKSRVKKLHFYSDASHGWLKVPKKLLSDLGVADKISEFSYMRGKNVYLEEDRDAGIFLKALEKAHGIKPELVKHLSNRSSIRNYDFYDTPTLKKIRWAKHPLATEAIETIVYKNRMKHYLDQGASRASANEKAIDDTIDHLRKTRIRQLKAEGIKI